MSNCTRNTWVAALAAGLLVWLMALSHGGAGLIGGLFLGFVTAGLVGGLVTLLFCSVVGNEGTEIVPGPAPTTGPAEPTMKTAPAASISIARPLRPAHLLRPRRRSAAEPKTLQTRQPHSGRRDRPHSADTHRRTTKAV